MGRGLPRGGSESSGAPIRFYAFLARLEALSSDVVINGTIFVYNRDASVMFDPGLPIHICLLILLLI